MSAIKPTVGRKVWFRPNGDPVFDTAAVLPQPGTPADKLSPQPLDATIVGVIDDHQVNLVVFDAVGGFHAALAVLLVDEVSIPPTGVCYATWMPFQVGQARAQADDGKTPAHIAAGISSLGWLPHAPQPAEPSTPLPTIAPAFVHPTHAPHGVEALLKGNG